MGRRRGQKRIKMCYVNVLTPRDECELHVPQTCTNKKLQ